MATTDESGNGNTNRPSKTRAEFPSNAGIGDLTLADELGRDGPDVDGADQVPVLGYQLISTTGDFYVPRDWLLETMDDVGLPEWMAPKPTQPHLAYRRAIDEMLEGNERAEPEPHMSIRFRFEKADGRRYVYTLMGNIHVDEERSGQPGGVNEDHELGTFVYDGDNGIQRLTKLDAPEGFPDSADAWNGTEDTPTRGDVQWTRQHSLYQAWLFFRNQRFPKLVQKHERGHIGKNINTMLNDYFLGQWTNSTMIRPAVYFVPATHTVPAAWTDGDRDLTMRDVIGKATDTERTGFAGLYAELNDFKHGEYADAFDGPIGADQTGPRTEDTEVIRVPVYKTDDQQEMIQKKVREEVRNAVGDVQRTVIERLREQGEAADEVAEAVADRVDEITAKGGSYSDIVKTEIEVRKIMDDVLTEMESEMDDAQTANLARDVIGELESQGTL